MNELHDGLRLYRDQLRDAAARDLDRRARPSRLALRIAAPTIAVGAVAAGLVLVLSGGPQASSADAAILHRVAAALTARSGTILHEQAIITVTGERPSRYELWQQSDAPYTYRVVKFGHEGSWGPQGYADYDPATNTIVEHAGSAGRTSPDDLAAILRSLVQSGKATIDERTTYGGVPAYRLTVRGAEQRFLNCTVYVATSDYHPLEVRTGSETIVFQTYEYLPASAANLELLDLTAQHPDAQVVRKDGGSISK
jgi:hypothetical protein